MIDVDVLSTAADLQEFDAATLAAYCHTDESRVMVVLDQHGDLFAKRNPRHQAAPSSPRYRVLHPDALARRISSFASASAFAPSPWFGGPSAPLPHGVTSPMADAPVTGPSGPTFHTANLQPDLPPASSGFSRDDYFTAPSFPDPTLDDVPFAGRPSAGQPPAVADLRDHPAPPRATDSRDVPPWNPPTVDTHTTDLRGFDTPPTSSGNGPTVRPWTPATADLRDLDARGHELHRAASSPNTHDASAAAADLRAPDPQGLAPGTYTTSARDVRPQNRASAADPRGSAEDAPRSHAPQGRGGPGGDRDVRRSAATTDAPRDADASRTRPRPPRPTPRPRRPERGDQTASRFAAGGFTSGGYTSGGYTTSGASTPRTVLGGNSPAGNTAPTSVSPRAPHQPRNPTARNQTPRDQAARNAGPRNPAPWNRPAPHLEQHPPRDDRGATHPFPAAPNPARPDAAHSDIARPDTARPRPPHATRPPRPAASPETQPARPPSPAPRSPRQPPRAPLPQLGAPSVRSSNSLGGSPGNNSGSNVGDETPDRLEVIHTRAPEPPTDPRITNAENSLLACARETDPEARHALASAAMGALSECVPNLPRDGALHTAELPPRLRFALTLATLTLIESTGQPIARKLLISAYDDAAAVAQEFLPARQSDLIARFRALASGRSADYPTA
ncbi:hypothetical protein [Kineosporia succinea]|uniref:DUF4192 family protein n=1 Tax=Kineosporia succinea TaxID=84632 RepID=A0ABT9P454_9ACTN|nr:hypothetical protein [Kineosporia succinea]MDP9827469.1 hypothetical protein [Kineosporia succinea]